jgi:hypothetical protein
MTTLLSQLALHYIVAEEGDAKWMGCTASDANTAHVALVTHDGDHQAFRVYLDADGDLRHRLTADSTCPCGPHVIGSDVYIAPPDRSVGYDGERSGCAACLAYLDSIGFEGVDELPVRRAGGWR